MPSEPLRTNVNLSADSLALDQDTIAAIATPLGRGGISVIRVSGPEAKAIAQRLTKSTLQIRQPALTKFIGNDDHIIDEGLTLFFQGLSSDRVDVAHPETGKKVPLYRTLRREYVVSGDPEARGSTPLNLAQRSNRRGPDCEAEFQVAGRPAGCWIYR